MNTAIQIWTCADHHAAFLCGGWAYVRSIDGQVSGAAGGERATTAHRMALAGLAAALAELPMLKTGASLGLVTVHTSSPELAGLAALSPGAAPGVDGDLWAQAVKALAGRKLNLIQVSVHPKTPMAFAAAWAELARDKAKARGAFRAVIPKPNLAKIAGLTTG
jgi:hypothetical protein